MSAWWWFAGIVLYFALGGLAWAACALGGIADDDMGVPRG